MIRKILTALVVAIVIALGFGSMLYFQKQSETKNRRQIASSNNFTSGDIVGSIKSESLGEYLTDRWGYTLYAYTDDKKLESACLGDCLKFWLPAPWDPNAFNPDAKDGGITDTLSKKINSAKASDGSRQYAFGDKPLYYYMGDEKPGDTNGNNLANGKWNIVPVETK